MNTPKSYITHIGTAVPPYSITQNEFVDHLISHKDLSITAQNKLRKIYDGSQIDKRHFVIDFKQNFSKYFSSYFSITDRMQWFEQHASALGIQAIKNSGIKEHTLASVTHLITVSCTGMYTPGIDVEIIKACGIPSTVARTCIYFMGCAAMINALKTADAICRAHPDAKILIVSVELCSLHFQNENNEDQMIANALFADGAACVLIQSRTDQKRKISLENFYSDLIKDTTQHMAWTIRNDGFMITLSAFIPNLIALGIKKLIEPMLTYYNVALSDIDHFAIHPGGPKILQRIEDILNIPAAHNAAAYDILKNYGNMSSATIVFILQYLLQTIPDDKQDQTILGMAFGPGLTVESALFKVSHD